MGSLTEQFLEQYRKAESLFGQLGLDGFRGAEAACDEAGMREASDRLRMCRAMRNFAAHAPGAAEFLEDPRARIKYLEKVAGELCLRIDPVSKHLDGSKENVWPMSAKAWEALASMSKRRKGFIGITSPNGIIMGTASIFDVSADAMLSRSATLTHTKLSKKVACVRPDSLYSEAPAGDVVFCTSDGTPSGKYLGVVKGGAGS